MRVGKLDKEVNRRSYGARWVKEELNDQRRKYQEKVETLVVYYYTEPFSKLREEKTVVNEETTKPG